jgi:peptide/nickel transport system substrate-binding protein
MRRRILLSAAMAAVGAGCLLAAALAGPASSNTLKPTASGQKKGGTMNLNMGATDVDFSDPALAYGVQSWEIEYATGAMLLSYADKPKPEGSKLIPEVAQALPTVSKDGKTYTFKLKNTYRLSNGQKVTAANFAYAINRDLNPKTQSPVVAFIANAAQPHILGADLVAAGKAQTASGVIAKGNTLTIKLSAPDGGLLAKLAMPFFCAIPTNLPIDANGVSTLPGAGPYYIASRQVGRSIVLKRNPFYKGPRPHNVDTFNITANTNIDQGLLQVKAGQVDFDIAALPPTAAAELAKQYGVNKGRFFVNQLVETDYIALNTSRPAFSSVAMRKAANYAVDRPAILRVGGAFRGKRTDQVLPPGMGGFKDINAYPMQGANYPKAKQLVQSAGGCKPITLYTATSTIGQGQGQVFKYNLSQIGCNVTVKLFQGFQLYVAAGTKGEPFDAAIAGWNQDYPDPYDFIDVLLNGQNIHDANNNNLAYLNVPALNKRMAAANRLTGDARYAAYGQLDVDITKNYAPWAAFDNRNQRDFVSARVGGYVFQPAYAAADLTTFFLK